MPKQLKVPVIILLLMFIAIAFLTYKNKIIPMAKSVPQKITIGTDVLPVLKPHGHTIGVDSVSDDEHGVLLQSQPFTVPEDMWISEFKTTIENAEYDNLHHLLLVRTGLEDPICPDYPATPIYVTSAENVHSPFTLQSPYRLRLEKGTQLNLYVMLHNPEPPLGEGLTRKNVRVHVTMKTDSNPDDKLKSVTMYRMHIADAACIPGVDVVKGEHFRVPAGAENDLRDVSHTFSQSGTIVFMGGHIHAWEGGKELRVFLNDSVIHTFTPIQKPGSKPWEWNIAFKNPSNIHVNAGDVIKIQSRYDNPQSVPINGAMGMMGFYFHPD